MTIWGESAGGSSVGFQLTAYNGRDDHLFRGAIMESGNPVYYHGFNGSIYYEPLYQSLLANVSCTQAPDTLECLRQVPYALLNAAFNGTLASVWAPMVDGDFIQKATSIQLAEGDFVHVPIISGANSDEGTAFSPQGVNTEQDFLNDLTSKWMAEQASMKSLILSVGQSQERRRAIYRYHWRRRSWQPTQTTRATTHRPT